ncbi:MAG: TonB-dependent receptor [Chlorobiota bacterium]|nr:MAG: TonB-dependent receptor [Chlorobiota bacterium]
MQWWGGQVLVLCVATAHVLAQRGDSVRYTFAPVLVEDSARAVVPAVPTAQITRHELERLPAATVADAVQGLPGVFVRNYGGLGGLKTISVRGATASQTAVVLEGIRLNAVANGLVDLGQLPTALLETITIERGSRSAVWGANAVGGTVELVLRQPGDGVRTRAAIGAFGERAAAIESSVSLRAHTISVLADVQSSRGDYPFTFEEFGTLQRIKRTNGDATLGSGVVRWQWRASPGVFRFTLFGRSSERGAPGAVLQGAIENAVARLSETEFLALASAHLGEGWTIRAAFRAFDQRYRDSLARFRGPNGADDRFIARDAAVVIEPPAVVLWKVSVAPKLEAYANTLRGDLYRFRAGSSATRLQLGGVIGAQYAQRIDSSAAVLLESGVRGDFYSDVPSAVIGLLQARWVKAHFPLALRMSLSTGYRPPSFNELYYQNFGSLDIRPERSVSVNAGVSYQHEGAQLELDGFAMWIGDQIIAVPRSAITWSVQNAGRVFSRGVEGAFRWGKPQWRLSAAGTVQLVTYDDRASFTYGKQVLYTPAVLGMFRIERQIGNDLRVLAQANYIGTRYTQTDNAPRSALPPVGTFDLSVEWLVHIGGVRLAATGELLNALDAEYAIIRNFPMPGRMWRLRLQVVLE